MVTFHAKLLCSHEDFDGYITYVFENLDYNSELNHYIMCTRFKNWEHCDVNVDEIGYLTVEEVIAGKSKWWDRNQEIFVPYNYSNIIFIKFVKETLNNLNKDIII